MVIEKKFSNITLHKFDMEPSSHTDLFPHYASVAMESVLPIPLPASTLYVVLKSKVVNVWCEREK
jgi:hypothetical protein